MDTGLLCAGCRQVERTIKLQREYIDTAAVRQWYVHQRQSEYSASDPTQGTCWTTHSSPRTASGYARRSSFDTSDILDIYIIPVELKVEEEDAELGARKHVLVGELRNDEADSPAKNPLLLETHLWAFGFLFGFGLFCSEGIPKACPIWHT